MPGYGLSCVLLAKMFGFALIYQFITRFRSGFKPSEEYFRVIFTLCDVKRKQTRLGNKKAQAFTPTDGLCSFLYLCGFNVPGDGIVTT